ncbi:MAG: hypothetical protein GWO20_00400 [Candidatus Korarchaeota archaeon]|nr:hypothetical protein [Candidatus Korarchaeota archaeon]NIU82037.1 hypothetical protein [Candidatus Thorarchaeota archaeon]NIW12456.1 hypothetical protein [Candidatus Thorarchaeota archaeon]NIW50671.1 hypothetical protein [Candidatus Korarchaeota archaeon]
MIKQTITRSGVVYLIVYLLFLVLVPIAAVRGWITSASSWVFLPFTSGVFTGMFLIGSVGAILTIPLGLVVSQGVKRNVLPLLSEKPLTRETIEETTTLSILTGVALFGVTIGIGVLGGAFGEPFPMIKEVFLFQLLTPTLI